MQRRPFQHQIFQPCLDSARLSLNLKNSHCRWLQLDRSMRMMNLRWLPAHRASCPLLEGIKVRSQGSVRSMRMMLLHCFVLVNWMNGMLLHWPPTHRAVCPLLEVIEVRLDSDWLLRLLSYLGPSHPAIFPLHFGVGWPGPAAGTEFAAVRYSSPGLLPPSPWCRGPP